MLVSLRWLSRHVDLSGLTPEQIALIDGLLGRERYLSYGRLQRLTAATAERLAEAGLAHGSRVLVLIPMQSELYVTLAAIWRLGPSRCSLILLRV